jgi:hypothetical protein
MSRKIVEKLTGIHDRRPPPSIQLLKNSLSPREVYRILPDVLILASTFHVGNDPPLPRLPRFWYREERAIGFHLTVVWDELKHTNFPQFIYEGSREFDLFLSHWGVFHNVRGGCGEKVHGTSSSESLPVLGRKFPP